MANIPVIVIQLIHIEGPLKGEIQDFSDPEISIGRHSSCHVQFPKDLRIISREHARIIREGNRFKLMNLSQNGTYLNGKRIPEAYLKDGDVLMFAQGGPKVSFLTRIEEGRPAVDISTSASPEPPQAPPIIPPAEPPPAPPVQAKPRPAPEISIQNTQVPLIIQYGPTLRSFNELPVTIGKGPGCDFILDHPSLLNQHAQLFYSQNQYWIKDLTGQQSVSVNGQPIHIQAPLNPDSRLSLSPQGPRFRFLEGGRLAEIEEPVPEFPSDELPMEERSSIFTVPGKDEPKKKGSIFKKLFS
ncbi:MAG: FHA domain-containing protein [Deltaproteobacteria bacterium]|nr:FHA domain-containing protein [Deltaproteobacteria bacterium]MBW2640611.1 FHA domain-containing protein [Deltaproteobacteria bacterium]MBW2679504.1 FHA domain-containing protein [Deltaproteobacteria bacterium]